MTTSENDAIPRKFNPPRTQDEPTLLITGKIKNKYSLAVIPALEQYWLNT